MNTTQNTQVQIDGTTYDVVKRYTVEDEITAGHLNSAHEMKRLRQAACLYLRKPKGSVVFFTVEFENGKIAGNPARLGRW